MSQILKLANKQFKLTIAPIAHPEQHWRYVLLRDGVIQGHWHEDGSTYEITCPPQLQDCLLILLNHAHLIELRGE